MTMPKKNRKEGNGNATKKNKNVKKEHIFIYEVHKNDPQPRMPRRKSNACLFVFLLK
jgi:hypothetical protein